MSIIKAKLHPPLMNFSEIYRSDIIDRIESKRDSSLFVVTGSPGSGKTTIVYQFLHKIKAPYIWYTLDENDNDPMIFSKYLVHAIESKGIIFDKTFDKSNIYEVLNFILNYFEDNHSKELYIVFDEYNFITNNDINEAIYQILKYSSKNLHIIIISNTRPNFDVSRFVLKNKALLVTNKELRLTEDEIAYLFELNGLKISKGEVKRIRQLTEGWLSGVILILRNYNNEEGKISERVSQLVDYFKFQVLEKLSENEKRVLETASLFGVFSPDLIRFVSGVKNAREVIEKLNKYNVFIEKIDENEYKLNNMFANYLRGMLEKNKQMAFLYEKAGDYFNGSDNERAIEYYVKSEKIDKLASIMDKLVDSNYLNRNYNRVKKWIDNFNWNSLVDFPNLLHLKLLTARYSRDYELFDKINEVFSNKYRNTRYYYLSLYEQSIDLFDRGELEKSEKLIRSVINNIKKTDNLFFSAYNVLGNIYIQKKEDEKAKQYFLIGEKAAYESGYMELYNIIKMNRLLPEIEKGNIEYAEKEISEIVKKIDKMINFAPLLLFAKIKFMKNEINKGIGYAKKALKLAKKNNYKYGIIQSLNILTFGYIYKKRIDKASSIANSAFKIAYANKDTNVYKDAFFNRLLIEILANNYEMAKNILNMTTEEEFKEYDDSLTYFVYKNLVLYKLGDISEKEIKFEKNFNGGLSKTDPEYFIYRWLKAIKKGSIYTLEDYQNEISKMVEINPYTFNEVTTINELIWKNCLKDKRDSTKNKYKKIRLYIMRDENISIESNGELQVIKFSSKIAKNLFLYFVFNKNEVIARDKIIDDFWGDKDYNLAGHLLRDYIYMIKKAFGEKVIQYKNKGYLLSESINWEIDYYRAKEYLHKGEILKDRKESLKAIDAIKKGLSMFKHIPLKNSYYNWSMIIRNEIEELIFRNNIYLTDIYINIGEYSEAEKILYNMKKLYPLEEVVYQWLMKLYYKEGRKDRLNKVYNELEETYKRELDLLPTEKSKMLYIKLFNNI